MTESIPSRRPAYFALAAIAVVLGFAVVLWPTNEGPGVQPLGDSAASFDDGPNEAEVMLPMPGLEGELGPEEPPQREEVDERVAAIADPLWIQVNDVEGKPAPGRTIAITSTGELPIWLVEEYHETDAAGQAVYDRSELLRIAKSNDWQEVIIGVWDWRARGFSVEQTVELSELRQISFVVPSESAILVQVFDLPKGFGPRIESIDGLAPAMHGVLVEDNWWRFQNVPHGHDWVINIVRGTLNTELGMISQPTSTNLPIQPVPGPAVSGEIVRGEYRLSDHACIFGRLVNELGEEFKEFDRVKNGLRVAAFGAYSNEEDEILLIEALGGGRFVLVPTRPATELSSFARLHFDWQPSKLDWFVPGEILPPSMNQVCSAAVSLPAMGPSMQLGDVVLRSDAFLLEVLVETETGIALRGANVTLRMRRPREGWEEEVWPAGWGSGWKSGLVPKLETGADGRVRFTAPSWDDVIHYSGLGEARLANIGTLEFVVNVEAGGFKHMQKVAAPGTNVMRVRLFRVGGLTGSVVSNQMKSMGLSIGAYPAGGDPLHDKPLAMDGVHFFSGERERFLLEQMPVETVDLYIQWVGESHGFDYGRAPWPILAVRRIEVGAGNTSAPDRLQEIQLDPLARWVIIDLGAPARERGVESMVVTLIHPSLPEQPLRSDVKVVNGVARVPLPIGVAAWTGTIDPGSFGTVEIKGLGPGRHSVQLEPRRALELRLTRPPQREGWALGLGEAPGLSAHSRGTAFDSSAEEMVTWVDGPGTVHCEWAAFDEEKGLVLIKGKFEVTEADIERGYVVITPPDGF